MIELFRNDFPNLRGRVKLLPNGPPVPYPVQFRVQGTDVATVRSIADQVKEVVRANPNTLGVNDNWNEQVKSLKLTLDQDKARALGVSSQALAKAAQTILSGTTVAQFREGNELVDIVLRQPYEERAVMSRLADASIPTASGRSVPLSQLVKVELGWEPGIVWRENRDYTITVQSEVKDGVQGPTVTAQINPQLATLRAGLPPGYSIDVAGAAEESAKAGRSIAVNVPLMLFIVFTLLMLQLHSFSRSLLVFLTGPLGFIGAAATLLVFRAPFGFVAQLGVLALLGMIIRNSVILVDQIERDRAAGRSRLGGDRRSRRAPLPSDHADRRGGGAGDDPAVAQRVLGADGGGDHGRPGRRHRADAALPSGAVRGRVPRAPAARGRRRRSRGAAARLARSRARSLPEGRSRHARGNVTTTRVPRAVLADADLDPGSVRGGDFADDRQAQPATGARGTGDAVIALEDAFAQVGRDARPLVADRERDAVIVGAQRDLDGATFRAVPQRVVDQVADEAAQLLPVAVDLGLRRRAARTRRRPARRARARAAAASRRTSATSGRNATGSGA